MIGVQLEVQPQNQAEPLASIVSDHWLVKPERVDFAPWAHSEPDI
jgi:hypothetical protein